jgi:photosystem II stability/assembly factor-like uncharacterized protein
MSTPLRTRTFRRAAVCFITAGLLLPPGFASAQQRVVYTQASTAYDTSYFGGLSFRNVGPVRGGRSIAVSGSSSRPNEYYFGAVGGGLWKTNDGGTTWRPVTDGQLTSSSVGAVQQCEANPDVVYIGMGESEFRGNIMQGDGIYKSTDAGRTWKHMGLEQSQTVARIRVHPTNCDLVYAAVLGHAYGPNPERGVYRSRDGGTTWERVLFRNENTGAVDLSMDPKNPSTMYAGFWQIQRTSWGMESGGPGGGLFRTTDGGTTWTELTKNSGLPAGIWGKIGVAVSPADGNRVFALIEANEGGVFRSDDGGTTWERTNDSRNLRQRAFYYTRIYADPQNKDMVYALNTGLYRSRDAGKTFQPLRPPHGDNHDLWISPADPDRMINSNDGGANVSVNAGETWTDQDFPTAQLYHIIATNHEPYWVCGAQQDNSTACVPSQGWSQIADIVSVGGGESGYIANDPQDPNLFYAGSYGGALSRYDFRTGDSQPINVWPENPMGHSSEDIRERFQWTYPIVFSRTGPKEMYVGSQHLWMTTTEGKSWQRISPDLTRADPKTMGPSGGPITKDQTGVETFATIFSIAPSPHDANTIWTGSDDGYVQVTRDHGKTWKNVTPKDLPEFSRISMIEVSPHRPGTAYVAAKRYQLDDRAPYIYRTDDYGATWTKTINGIAPNDFVQVVREDPVRANLLFAGTEHSLYISFDNGANWTSFRRNLPDLQVADLVIKDNDLVIGTHGRSAWIMNDISQLRQLTPAVVAADFHLFKPVVAEIGRDNSVPVTYYLKAPASSIKLEILDANGQVIRTYDAQAAQGGGRGGRGGGGRAGGAGDEEEGGGGFGRGRGGFGGRLNTTPGTHRFSWDMRYPGATTFDNLIMWAAGTNGPTALPGSYSVRLTVDSKPPQTESFTIGKAARLANVTMEDLKAKFDLAMKIRDETSQANQAVIDIRDVKGQVDDRIGKDGSVRQPGTQLKDKFTDVEGEIYQYRNQSGQDPLNFPIMLNNKIAALMGAVEGVDGEPTAQSYEVYDYLSGLLDQQMNRLDVLIRTDLEEFNKLLRSKGLDPIKPPERARRTIT